jgi:hypothetical protein
MNKILLSLIATILLMPASLFADSYSSLWKQVNSAAEKDLPKTQIEVLKKIIDKATVEKCYGQLLAAELKTGSLQVVIAPDSLKNQVDRLKKSEQSAAQHNAVLAAVYQTALGKIYQDNQQLGDDHAVVSKDYFKKAMSNPSLLAGVSASTYEPLVREGYDSKIFDDDLLSVIGFETGDYKTLHDYYKAHGNRLATCISAYMMVKADNLNDVRYVKKSKYLITIDSLINEYQDIPEAGELAIEHYNFIKGARDVTVKDRYDYINYALMKWGAWPHINVLRNEQKELTRPMFLISVGKGVILPNKTLKIDVQQVRNLQQLTMTVWRADVDGDYSGDPNDAKDYASLRTKLTPLSDKTKTINYMGLPSYQLNKDSILLDKLPVGVYMLEFTTDNKEVTAQRALIRVSDLFVLHEALPNNKIRFAVVNSTTGQPVPGASLRVTTNEGYNRQKQVQNLTMDAKGEASYHYARFAPDMLYPYTADDKACAETSFWNQFSYYDNYRVQSIVNLFTDRSVYRPGQTVHVSAIVYKDDKGLETSAEVGKTFKLTLRDANYKTVGEKDVTTDNMGTTSADFTLPSSGLNGLFSVTANYGNRNACYISVDEYKRPTFQVEFPKVNSKYQNGDTLIVTGHAKTYSGVPVQGAKVAYKVTRRQALWWWRMNNINDEVVMQDTVITDADGAFKVEMPMVLPADAANSRHPSFYNFNVIANVTDVGGESHEGDMSLPLGSKPTAFSCDLPDKIERDSLRDITFSFRNAAGENINSVVRYTIDKSSASFNANTNVKTTLDESISKLSSGRHHLSAVCDNDTIERDFVIFSMEDKTPVVETHDWFYQTSNKFPRDGRPVYVQVGSSDDNTHILYTLISGNNILESGTFDLSNALKTWTIPYKEEYGSGVLLTLAWVKDGKAFTHQARIERQLPDKKLVMKWTTFRNNLTPGQKEQWTLNITKEDGKPANAQLMATLYDKSLDQIRAHDWQFKPLLYQYLPNSDWRGSSYNMITSMGEAPLKYLKANDLNFSSIDDSFFDGYMTMDFYGDRMIVPYTRMSGAKMMMRTAKVGNALSADNKVEVNEMVTMAKVDETPSQSEEQQQTKSSSQVRENLNETAFFFPALTSDGKGNVGIRFTLPESVTTWRFIGLAHDADMNTAMLTDEAVAKKTVMIQPNLPRFIRTGDKAQIVARIFNTSEKDVNGTAKLELIDPETEHKVYSQDVKYSVAAGQTQQVAFDYSPDGSVSLLVCKVIAEGKGYSDGEQNYLPILPDKELVTTTVPFTQNGPGTKTIDLQKLFPVKDKNNKLTVEYTNNPVWLMVQALPSLATASDDNAISLVSAYYANSIASNILHSSPKIKPTIQQWMQEKGKETSLMSNLQKNQELKELVLNETPWVASAEKETDQKEQLINFFDESQLDYRLSSTLQRLRMLQNPDGSWSWWKGMEGSWYMTSAVVKTLVRLNAMTGKHQECDEMLSSGFDYLSKGIVKDVKEMKESEKKGIEPIINDSQIDFLYICAIDGRSLPSNVNSANNYLLDLLQKKNRNVDIYDKAVAAIVLNKFGKSQMAREYVKSIKEYTVYTEEMGRYYDTHRAAYSWCDYRIPTQVAAIEALKAVTPNDKQTVEEMQRWLLQAKRTQSWDTPINSVNAVYAFLNGETQQLVAKENTKLAVNGKNLQTSKTTAGLGYVKTALTDDNFKTFTADKSSEGTSWGALYAQYMQTATDITSSASGISVTREVISGNGQLTVGDRVKVRITIHAERDFDFVQLVDKRAACMEPVNQLSGYHYGYYCSPKDYTTNYYFNRLSKGDHKIETEYYIDRLGTYATGTCTVQCAYSPEYSGRAAAKTIEVK